MGEQSQVSREAAPATETLPPELEGKTLPPGETEAGEAAEAVVAQNAGRVKVADPAAAAAFAADIHAYVREYISLADQKAGVLFTVMAGMLAYLQVQSATRRWMVSPLEWGFLDALAFVAVAGLTLGAALALGVVVPRTRGSSRGFVFWGAIAEYREAREYADGVAVCEAPSLVRAKLEHCHELAMVCRRKYWFLDKSIWCGAVGLGAAVVCIVLS